MTASVRTEAGAHLRLSGVKQAFERLAKRAGIETRCGAPPGTALKYDLGYLKSYAPRRIVHGDIYFTTG